MPHGNEFEQPADLVILCAFAQHNVHLLLLSGIGKPYDPKTGQGVVGSNYAYQITSSVDVFFEDKIINPFMGAGALGQAVDDFNGDNFDHRPWASSAAAISRCGRPAAGRSSSIAVPEGTPNWGGDWKKASRENYLRRLDRHARQRHELSRQLPRSRSDLSRRLRQSAAAHDVRLHTTTSTGCRDFLTDKAADDRQGDEAALDHVKSYREGHYSIVPYQTTHNTGGAAMGTDPATSVVNRYLQCWDVPNVFVHGLERVPAEPRLQPDRHRGRARLLGRRRHPQQVSALSGTARPGLNGVWRARSSGQS